MELSNAIPPDVKSISTPRLHKDGPGESMIVNVERISIMLDMSRFRQSRPSFYFIYLAQWALQCSINFFYNVHTSDASQ
mgnify:CR=1 FL=1